MPCVCSCRPHWLSMRALSRECLPRAPRALPQDRSGPAPGACPHLTFRARGAPAVSATAFRPKHLALGPLDGKPILVQGRAPPSPPGWVRSAPCPQRCPLPAGLPRAAPGPKPPTPLPAGPRPRPPRRSLRAVPQRSARPPAGARLRPGPARCSTRRRRPSPRPAPSSERQRAPAARYGRLCRCWLLGGR